MPFQPSPKQALAVFGLLFARTPEEREPMKSKIKPKLYPKERQQLVDAGLLELEKRGQAEHVRATDVAWDWAGAHLDATMPKSPHAKIVLENLLATLSEFLPKNELALADLVLAGRASPASSVAHEESGNAHVRKRILAAIADIAGGASKKRVRLSQLRERLGDVPRERLDQELLEMQAAHRLVLYRLDNPVEVTPADQHAAVLVAGNPRHLVYLEA